MENVREIIQIMTRRFGFLNKNCCSAGGCDISLIQSHILYEIDRRHKPSIQQVAEALGTDITTFSRQVQSLIKMKLVKKTPDPGDRRVQLLSLTTEGKDVAVSIDRQMNDYLNEIFSHMNDFDKDTVLRSIKLLNEAMAKSGTCCSPPSG
ncbi:MarR family winged helix-turn-helix transcriptional regulator [Paenibacillus contaminans]|uniref:MarR family transcriptional regulator n=1 Tax=Paenibacillus contaminans TaxID=450362 RepID=A0A329MR63_9BACL|nr:MarR family winged helix-turn-helix transcriptional regulator [Paenibacillus contaminans]RAV22425.1 MarR family transcriptional regulator [Paenibacillus contaminans]